MSLRQALWLGALSGVRSLSGLAALTEHASRLPMANGNASMPDILRAPETARLIRLMQMGEIVMDKMPFIPPRTAPLPLMGRMAIGALVGGLAYRDDRVAGAVAGASMAVLGASLGYRVRKNLHERYAIPDPILAVIEDAISVAAAKVVVEDMG